MDKSRASTDAFDRVADLVVSLLEAGDESVDASIVSGLANVALASSAYIDTGEQERWWPNWNPGDEESARELAATARRLDRAIISGRWRLAAPLRGDNGAIGAFVVERPFPFTNADRLALSRAGVAIGQALLWVNEIGAARRRIAELERLAFEDETTGLANRRALLRRLDGLVSEEEPLTLLFIDFDGLRAVNNQLSYEHGNELLRAVTAEIEKSLGPAEFAARLHGSGGDEFIVVCPTLDGTLAEDRALILERALAPTTIELSPELSRLYRGASVGFALRQTDEATLDLLERAGRLMRLRKSLRQSRL